MHNHEELQNRLRHKEIVLMDGGMGTEILRRGVPTTLPLWSAEALLTHPDVVQRIHEDSIRAGAEIIITDTFRTTRWAFAKKGQAEKARDMTLHACQLVHQAIKQVKPAHPVYIAGSMAPLEDCYSPELTPSNEHLAQEHYLYARDLKAGGVDFLLLETMITLRETMSAIQAAKKLAMPFAVSFCTNPQTTLLGGETLENVLKEVEQHDPLFIGVNCVSPETATHTLQALRKLTSRPLSVYAQGDGIPDNNQGWQFNEAEGIEHYAMCAQSWLQEGAQIIGGCCGTTPAYIERLRRLF
jgi:S-methylmethionine-dependent homocysteine/selenocysteine methylase